MYSLLMNCTPKNRMVHVVESKHN